MKRTIILGLCLMLFIPVVIADMEDDMILYWSFDDNATDDSGNGWNGTESNADHVESCKMDGCYNFSYSDRGYIYSANYTYVASDPITVSGWYYVTTTSADLGDCWSAPALLSHTPSGGSNGIVWGLGHGSAIQWADRPIVFPGVVYVEDYNASHNLSYWHHAVYRYDGSYWQIYLDGNLMINQSEGNQGGTLPFIVGGRWDINHDCAIDGMIDEIGIWNRSITDAEVIQLYGDGDGFKDFSFMGFVKEFNISDVNCTSSFPSGDTTEPYTTSDTTPTFRFNTSFSADCRISDENVSYDEMNSSRDCAGQGTLNDHVCTLTEQDEIIYDNTVLYISCHNSSLDDPNASISLQMNITDLPVNRTKYMDLGISTSIIGGLATIYEDQKVFLRSADNSQVSATVDRALIYGDQRWLINYDNSTTLGLFNITPVVYVLEIGYPDPMTYSEIQSTVGTFINGTKS